MTASPSTHELFEELFGLKDSVALVTGARQGIGRAIALGLGRAGARVAATSRRLDSLQQLGRELDESGIEHAEIELDVTDPASVERGVEEATRRWGRLDVAVNNAGAAIRKDAHAFAVEEWNEILDTNLRGAFLVSRAAARAMEKRGGRIINLSSTFARFALSHRAPYAASKAGLEQLTRVLALEWAPYGITVNAVAPGAILTESRQATFASERTRLERIRRIPRGRLGEPEDVLGAVLLLAGAAGGYITGATILVDGGYTLGSAEDG